MQEPMIVPTLLSANFANLERDIRLVEKSGGDMLHLDIMDGHFVPNITIGPVVIESIRKMTRLHLQSHLMVENPDAYIKAFADAGSDSIIVHHEATSDPLRTLAAIKNQGKLAGIAIKPKTEVLSIEAFLDKLDVVLIMSVEPGFGGQSFIPESVHKIKELVALLKKRNLRVPIGVDGGINSKTILSVAEAGAEHLIAGNAVFRGDIEENMKILRETYLVKREA